MIYTGSNDAIFDGRIRDFIQLIRMSPCRVISCISMLKQGVMNTVRDLGSLVGTVWPYNNFFLILWILCVWVHLESEKILFFISGLSSEMASVVHALCLGYTLMTESFPYCSKNELGFSTGH